VTGRVEILSSVMAGRERHDIDLFAYFRDALDRLTTQSADRLVERVPGEDEPLATSSPTPVPAPPLLRSWNPV
jgi:hypothetical protein